MQHDNVELVITDWLLGTVAGHAQLISMSDCCAAAAAYAPSATLFGTNAIERAFQKNMV